MGVQRDQEVLDPLELELAGSCELQSGMDARDQTLEEQ